MQLLSISSSLCWALWVTFLQVSAAPTMPHIEQDSGVMGPTLEIVHLFDRFPSGWAISSTGRIFAGHTRLDPSNANYTVSEITGFDTEKPYPSAEMNSPPGGPINYTVTPPVGANYQDYLISEASVIIDAKDRLWILDNGRPSTPDFVTVPSALGGPKLVGVDLATDTVFQTIVFNRSVVFADSWMNDVVFDLRPELTPSGKGIAYLTDSSPEGRGGIVIVDLGTGVHWRHVVVSPSVKAEANWLAFVWGEPVYANPGGGRGVRTLPTSSDGIALSPDGETLWYSVLPSRYMYSVPTARLRDQSQTAEILAVSSVQQHSQKGVSDGFTSDTNGYVYFGGFETNSINIFFPSNGTVSTYVRDPRMGWTDTLWIDKDHLYFTENQNWRSGAQSGGVDKRVKPFVAYRVPMPDGGTTLALQ